MDGATDFRSRPSWQDLVEPYQHQVDNLINFCRRLPVTLLADDVGLGKTISAGLIMSELIARSRMSKILIVCPKLLGPQWKQELDEKFAIDSKIATGRDLINTKPADNSAIITTYHSARLHIDKLPEDRFDMLILDEAHKLRNLYGVDPPPQVAQRFRQVLEDRRFRFVLMLTATPIQNRLWDMYSLVDLLTVARGHENPFGSQGMFARRFIADERTQARVLKEESREEFRSIVYSYMSRVRRIDAQLYFPDRVVQMHKVVPSADELKLIDTISEPIQTLNRLTQISILQALVSSPDALRAQLNNMGRNGTVPIELARSVDSLVKNSRLSAKLVGLGALIDSLREKNPSSWRLVIFTTRRETQTTIENFLGQQGISVGCINGDSGARNQHTIADFKLDPPRTRVIVSTEAGSEGVNLQAANVLVNYDLPWNPMIVEQRIGRVQRLASEHKSVAIFNITLAGTFEEYIVGRLMEKLQMAAQAIGDVESLLEGSGLSDGDEGGGFEERIRGLVLQALAGKDVEEETRLAAESVQKAKATLERESEEIDSLLGGASGKEYAGPRTPDLPVQEPSLSFQEFALSAFRILGAEVTERSNGIYQIDRGANQEFVHFNESLGDSHGRSVLLHPASAKFLRLVAEMTASGIFTLRDVDSDSDGGMDAIAADWVSEFGGHFEGGEFNSVERCFSGSLLTLVRATVAHDSYERLVDVNCDPAVHKITTQREGMRAIPNMLEEVLSIGVNLESALEDAMEDAGVSEFRRFYLERRADELEMAKGDMRKQRNLEDEFTPKLSMTVVGLDGEVWRQVETKVHFRLDDSTKYSSLIVIRPSTGEIVSSPALGVCEESRRQAPVDCFAQCAVTGKTILRHFLKASEESGQLALPDKLVVCAVSNKHVLPHECEFSEVTGDRVLKSLLVKSDVSGRLAEEIHSGVCEFTSSRALVRELERSEVSGKIFRKDQKTTSIVSGVTGHTSEFVNCEETRQPILASEADVCEVTGKKVIRDLLARCSETQKRALLAELDKCEESGDLVLKDLLVTSSVSSRKVSKSRSLMSSSSEFCTLGEGIRCQWSGTTLHPSDVSVCETSGLRIAREYIDEGSNSLLPLWEMLVGIRRTAHLTEEWAEVATQLSGSLGGSKCEIEAAVVSTSTQLIACVARVKKLFGLRTLIVGFIFDQADGSIFGEIAVGTRTKSGWSS